MKYQKYNVKQSHLQWHQKILRNKVNSEDEILETIKTLVLEIKENK